MSRTSGALAALKAVPGGARYTPAPQSGGWGAISPVQANAQFGNPSASSYGPFLPRPSRVFTDGAFSPMAPIQPVPVDEPPPGAQFPDPRWWQYRTGWNLPTQPGSEGLKLASFDQLYTLASKYSVARTCVETRKEEIRGLEWEVQLTTKAAKAYQGDSKAMRDFGERAAEATRFFRNADPDYWNFSSFLDAVLEEIFVYDALALIFRPKYGKGLGRGLLGSDLDSMRLVSGPTIRPLLDMHGGKPRPPAPAYQQFLFGVPRSDYQTVIAGTDVDDYGLAGSEVNQFRADTMLYAPLVSRRETPYGFPPVERALLPIVSGLQKQEFQLSYFTEGTVPAVYISPGDANMTPTQIRELQDALNGVASDPAYHLKVIVLPPNSRVDPQRPVDLSDGFDLLVQTQVCMAFDIQPDEIGLLPNIAGAGPSAGASSSGVRLGAAASRDLKDRKSTKPLLMFLCDIMDYVLQGICGQPDMQFRFEGLQAEDDKQALVDRGVQGIQNGLYSIDEVRGWLDLPPWGLQETSEPVVFTAQGPVPFSMAPDLIRAAITGSTPPGQGTNSGQRTPSTRSRTKQPTVRAGGQTKPNGSHPAPVADHREAPLTGAHAAAAGAIQSPTPRTGGTTSRSSVAGSRKKAVEAELGALARHLRKGREITTWVAEHIPARALSAIAEDIAKGVLIDTAVERAGSIVHADDLEAAALKSGRDADKADRHEFAARDDAAGSFPGRIGLDYRPGDGHAVAKTAQWPGWERDLGLVGAYKHLIGQAFHDAESRGSALRKKAATGGMFVSNGTLRDLIGDEVRDVFSQVLTPLWTEAWHLGYAAAKSLVTGEPADFAAKDDSEHLRGFIGSEEQHWLDQIGRTGLGNNSARSETIARTEVARAINSAAIQCYRDHGVSHKHLLVSPGACEICDDVADDGDIALDAPFTAGGVLGLVHPACVIGSTRVAAPESVPRPEAGRLSVDAPFAPLGVLGDGGLLATSAVAVAERDFGRRRIRAVSDREFVGDVITIRTAAGYELTATPNHPIATRRGWVPVAELAVGDHVLSSTRHEWPSDAIDPDVDNVPPCIKDVAETFSVSLGRMPTAPEDFHGDGAGSKIHVVRTDRFLMDRDMPAVGEHVGEQDLGRGNIPVGSTVPFDAEGLGFTGGEAVGLAALGSMGGAREFTPFLRCHAGHTGVHALAAIAGLDACLQEAAADGGAAAPASFSKRLLAFASKVAGHQSGLIEDDILTAERDSGALEGVRDVLTADSEGFCGLLETLSADIKADQVVSVRWHEFSGHVYNLETDGGWYIGNGIVTHNCRCVPAPAGVEAEPPLAGLGKAASEDETAYLLRSPANARRLMEAVARDKSAAAEDESRAAFLMMRARHPADGKPRYLLQRRPDGDWGLPGGCTHVGEAPHAAAVRESTEEIGDLPPLGSPLAVTQHPGDGKTFTVHLHEVPFFQPANNGSTPEETAGTGWFRRGEVGDLDLHPPFREQWEAADWKHLGKSLQRAVNETGEVSTLTPASQRLQASGARWPYPHRADGAEWPDAGPGAVPDEHGSAGGEPPNRINDMAEGTHARVYPRGGKDSEFPRRRTRNRPAARFPEQGEQDQDEWPYPQATVQAPASTVGAPKGAQPVTGSVPAEAPQGYRPHSYEPQAFDPGLCAVCSTPEGNVIHSLPKGAGGPSDFTDPNPVDAETVYLAMSKNFPPDAIGWVKRATWVGPVWVPWPRVDQDDRDKWAASHQRAKVREFEQQITAHAGHVAPSILVQEPGSQKAFIVDGHHRALARENLGQKVLAYLGNVDPKDLPAARETHTRQIHSGSDPGNA